MRKQLLPCLWPLLVAVSLVACASNQVEPANPKVVAKMQAIDHTRMACIVIYRPEAHQGWGLHPTVVLDGKDLVNIGNGKVFLAPITPGHYVFEMDDKKSGTEVNLQSGQELYLKVEVVPGFWVGGGKLTQMAPQQGNYEAMRLDLIEPNEIDDARFR